MAMMTKDQSLGLKELYSEWFNCPFCNKNDILRKFKFCPNCSEELDWSFYKDDEN